MAVDEAISHPSISVKLNVVNVKMSRQIGQAVQKLANLRLPEWRIMALLASAGSLSQADIRNQIGMDKGQISRTVKNMLANGLVVNESGTSKTRNVRLSLTEKGREVHHQVDIMMEQRNAELLAALSDEQKSMLFDGLDRIERTVDSWTT
ncbi:MAG: MarR family winged helix-turn-helix transcriptional regulator [Pseudomonadota bacterium]